MIEDDSLTGTHVLQKNRLPPLRVKKILKNDEIVGFMKDGKSRTEKQIFKKSSIKSIGDLHNRLEIMIDAKILEKIICEQCDSTQLYRLK